MPMTEVDTRYATALYEMALAGGSLEEFLSQVTFLRDTLEDASVRRILTHPQISRAAKHDFFRDSFEGRIHVDLQGFLHLMVENRREEFLVSTLSALVSMIDEHMRKTTATIISAVELSDEQCSAIKQVLSRKLDKQVEIAVKVDPTVVGGFYIQVDGFFIDRTVKKQLHDIKVSIEKECGA